MGLAKNENEFVYRIQYTTISLWKIEDFEIRGFPFEKINKIFIDPLSFGKNLSTSNSLQNQNPNLLTNLE